MTRERFTLPVAVFLLLVQDNKILLLRRANTGWQDGNYDLVAGHIEGNETLTSALSREVEEEIGVRIAPHDFRYALLIHSFSPEDSKEYLQVFFEAKEWQNEPRILETDKCDDLRWFPIDNLPVNLTPATKNALQAYAAGDLYIERGFEKA
jgi:8-oxo-dGTP pyrophosphatase MutT (NUDIX family)